MLVKLSPENQLTVPAQAIDALGHPSQFELSVEGNRLVLTPSSSLDAVRDHLAAQGITEQDVTDAVEWARHGA